MNRHVECTDFYPWPVAHTTCCRISFGVSTYYQPISTEPPYSELCPPLRTII